MVALRHLELTWTTAPIALRVFAGAWSTCLAQEVVPRISTMASIMVQIGSSRIQASMTLCRMKLL